MCQFRTGKKFPNVLEINRAGPTSKISERDRSRWPFWNSHPASWRNARQGGIRVQYAWLCQSDLGRHVGRSCCDYFVDLFWLAHVLELMLAEVGETQFRGKPLSGELSRGG
jgi:hypothetical protein